MREEVLEDLEARMWRKRQLELGLEVEPDEWEGLLR
jgi:hypothetical protein